MDDNEKDLTQGKSSGSDMPVNHNDEDSAASYNESGRVDDYEGGDSWQFEAEAPTISDDLFLNNDKFVVDENEFKTEINSETKNENSAQEIIKTNKNTEPLKFIPVALFIVIVTIVLTVLGVRYYTVPNGKEGDLMNPAGVAATIEGEKVSLGMFNYYYSSIVSYYEQYAMYGYFDLDTSKDYSQQFTTDDDGNEITWEEFFKQEALEEIKLTSLFYKKGLEEGVTLNQTQKDTVESQIKKLKDAASEQNITLDKYISDNFGEYCNEETIRLMFNQYYTTVNYKGKYSTDCEISQEDIDKYYEENKTDFYQMNFSYLATEYDATSDETKAASEKKINEIMDKITDRDSIIALVPEIYEDYISQDAKTAMESDSSLTEEQAKKSAIASYEQSIDATVSGSESPFTDEVNEWLFSDDTAIGSKNYSVDEESGYAYIILKTENAVKDESQTYTVRHILIAPEADESSSLGEEQTEQTYTEEQWNAAEEKANSILDEFNSSDKSEYAFALLAESNTKDTASTSAGSSENFGGLYEGVGLGEMVPEFEEWATDDARQKGDTGIVKSDYGYHIMYFIKDCPAYESRIVTQIRNDRLNKMVEDADFSLHDSVVNKAMSDYQTAKKAKSAASAAENTGSVQY